jgi:hypothetical protein
MKPFRTRLILLVYVLVILSSLAFKPFPPEEPCAYWVAPEGSDANPGTQEEPWATLEYAAARVPDEGCTVWFRDGLYTGDHRIRRRFETYTRFKAENPYQVILENDGPVVTITGGSRIILEGFVFQHSGPGADSIVVQVYRNDDVWAEYIYFRNNIFRDSYNSDLLKVYNGARFVTISGNLFYNQGKADQQIDVNSVTDVTIQDNIFFNDFAASGRPVENDTKHYIVIKDSNGADDGLLGSQRIKVQRNIFMNWQGAPGETFLQVGNDGKPYFEARDVLIENNLFLGNSEVIIGAAFGVSGAQNVKFIHNTVSGNLPARAYAARIDIKGDNPKNENILMCNNIWSDPTGSMGAGMPESEDRDEFSDGNPDSTINLTLEHNLYWNGEDIIPDGEILSPLWDDPYKIVADPYLDTSFADLVLPVWRGERFLSGNTSIRQEFLRIAGRYAALPQDSPALWQGSPLCGSSQDIFRLRRDFVPSFGADQGARWFSMGGPYGNGIVGNRSSGFLDNR